MSRAAMKESTAIRLLKRAIRVYGADELAALEVARQIGAQFGSLSPAVPREWRLALRGVMRELLEKGGLVPACRYCACREDSACELLGGEACAWVDEGVCSNPRCIAEWHEERAHG